jgi:hypothetical protein
MSHELGIIELREGQTFRRPFAPNLISCGFCKAERFVHESCTYLGPLRSKVFCSMVMMHWYPTIKQISPQPD